MTRTTPLTRTWNLWRRTHSRKVKLNWHRWYIPCIYQPGTYLYIYWHTQHMTHRFNASGWDVSSNLNLGFQALARQRSRRSPRLRPRQRRSGSAPKTAKGSSRREWLPRSQCRFAAPANWHPKNLSTLISSDLPLPVLRSPRFEQKAQ